MKVSVVDDLRDMDQRIVIALLWRGLNQMAWVMALGVIAIGGTLYFGADARTSGPSYVAFRQTPGGSDTWGLLWMTMGTLLGVSRLINRARWVRMAKAILNFVAAIMTWFMAGAFVIAVADNPIAGLTAVPVYIMLGGLFVCLAVFNMIMYMLHNSGASA